MNDSSEYYRRIKIAFKWSLGIHVAMLIIALCWPDGNRTLTVLPPEPVYVFNVGSSSPGHYIDTLAPAHEPVAPTDLIAEQDSKAQDMSDVVGTRQAPYFEEASEFDQLASSPPSGAPPAAQPTPPSLPPPVREAEMTAPKAEPVKTVTLAKSNSPAGEAKEPPIKQSDNPQPIAQQPQAPMPAQGQPTLPGAPPGLAPGESRGRVDGGVVNKGVLGYEAAEHQIAPYMKEIRSRVERNWRSALQLKFTGTQPTKAVLDCAITPEGKIAYVKIVDAGSSNTYAPLCKEAVEKSGPFPPFPFDVPDVYRSQNLEIRWTFSFLEQ